MTSKPKPVALPTADTGKVRLGAYSPSLATPKKG